MKIEIIKKENQYQTYLGRMKEIFDAKHGSVESLELDELANVLEKYENINYPI